MKLVIFGVGKMGGAILAGILQANTLAANDIGIYDVSQTRLNELNKQFGVKILTEKILAEKILAEHNNLTTRALIAVKPQTFTEIAPKLVGKHQAYISIMAGVSTETIATNVESRRVIRVMPNLGASVGHSATAFCCLPEATKEDIQFSKAIFQAIGEVFPIPETIINAFTGLAGSGPAFVAILAEALADGGVSVGLSRDLAKELTRQVLLASAKLLAEKNPADLKDEVSSPKGTTIAGVTALERYGLRYAAIQAVQEATQRAEELSKS